MEDKVVVQHEETKRWDRKGSVMEKGDHRKYLIKLDNGRKLWRNRQFLRLILREETPQEVDRSGGNIVRRKPPNAERRVTFQDDPDEMVDDQSMKLRSKRGINYRALAGMK